VELAEQRIRERTEPVFVVADPGEARLAAGEVLDPLEPEVNFDFGELASAAGAVAGAVVSCFDDVVEDQDGGACVSEHVHDATVDPFDVSGAIGIEIVDSEEAGIGVEDCESGSSVGDVFHELCAAVVRERFARLDLVEAGEVVEGEAELEESLACHRRPLLEVDPHDGLVCADPVDGEGGGEPRLEGFGFA
jgi:hypothetical protein